MFLDDNEDWREIAELLTESYRILAPRAMRAATNHPRAAH
jgi:hypothetical protein